MLVLSASLSSAWPDVNRSDIIQINRDTQYVQSNDTKQLQEQLPSIYHDAQPLYVDLSQHPPTLYEPWVRHCIWICTSWYVGIDTPLPYCTASFTGTPASRQEHDAIMKLRPQELLRLSCSRLLSNSRLPSTQTHCVRDGALKPVTVLLYFWPSLKSREASVPGWHISLPFHLHHSIVPLLMLGHCVLSWVTF